MKLELNSLKGIQVIEDPLMLHNWYSESLSPLKSKHKSDAVKDLSFEDEFTEHDSAKFSDDDETV